MFLFVNFFILILWKALLAPGAVPPLVQLLMMVWTHTHPHTHPHTPFILWLTRFTLCFVMLLLPVHCSTQDKLLFLANSVFSSSLWTIPCAKSTAQTPQWRLKTFHIKSFHRVSITSLLNSRANRALNVHCLLFNGLGERFVLFFCSKKKLKAGIVHWMLQDEQNKQYLSTNVKI